MDVRREKTDVRLVSFHPLLNLRLNSGINQVRQQIGCHWLIIIKVSQL